MAIGRRGGLCGCSGGRGNSAVGVSPRRRVGASPFGLRAKLRQPEQRSFQRGRPILTLSFPGKLPVPNRSPGRTSTYD